MRNATSMDSSAGATADLQAARQGCVGLGHQAEGLAELMVPLLRQATQELHRLETQRDELRKTATREVPQALLPKLLERIEEQAQNVKRLERASRGLKEFISSLDATGEQLRQGLSRQEEEQREREAITREEKRMWLRELNSLREQVTHAPASSPAGAQLEELQRLRSESEVLPKLRAERDRLGARVAEQDKQLATREQTLAAKEQTIADLRRMILLLTGDKDTTSSPEPVSAPPTPTPPPTPELAPVPVAITMLGSKSAPARPRVPVVEKPAPAKAEGMFGNSTMQLAHSMLETLGEEAPSLGLPTLSPTPLSPVMPERKTMSMEVMLGPLDELESMPRPLTPPPVALPPPIPLMPPVVAPVAARPAMPRASARVDAHPAPPTAARGDTLHPAPRGPAPATAAPRLPVARPGTLIISEDMFNEMLVEENTLGTPDKK